MTINTMRHETRPYLYANYYMNYAHNARHTYEVYGIILCYGMDNTIDIK